MCLSSRSLIYRSMLITNGGVCDFSGNENEPEWGFFSLDGSDFPCLGQKLLAEAKKEGVCVVVKGGKAYFNFK